MTTIPAALQRIISRLWMHEEDRDDLTARLWNRQHPTEKVSGDAVQKWRLRNGWKRAAYSHRERATYQPTAEQIEAAKAEVQSHWSDWQRREHNTCPAVRVGLLTVHVGQGQSTAAALLEAELVEVRE